jgi:hypothetical protein
MARVGYCSVCFHWLGTAAPRTSHAAADGKNYGSWVSASVGQFLSMMPNLTHLNLPSALQTNLERCWHQTVGATKEGMAKLAGAGPCVFRGWISGQVKPTLEHLCRLSYEVRLPLVWLFEGVPIEWRAPARVGIALQESGLERQSEPRIEPVELQKVLTAALIENPPPTVAEIARCLKFRCTQTLVSRAPDLCKRIAARRRDSGLRRAVTKFLFGRSRRGELEAILRDELALQDPPSLNEIAAYLGYKSSGGIRERFPQLCVAIVAKRRQRAQCKREIMRRALENARAQTPPPSLKKIARQLGYAAEISIVKIFPEMCGRYKEWRKTWARQHRSRLRLSIRDWMKTETSPSIASACHHFGFTPAYLQVRFPSENAELVRMFAEQARRDREASTAAQKEEVYGIVKNLLQKNLYPSLSRVQASLNSKTKRSYLLLRPAIEDALARLSAMTKFRNKRGQSA